MNKQTYKKPFLGVIFVMLAGSHLFGQAALVRTRTLFQTTNSNTITLGFTAASTTGNLIVVHLSYSGQTQSIISVTDNKSNTYTRINGPTNFAGINFYRSELWYAFNITGGGANLSITATLSGGTPIPVAADGLQFMQIYMTEFSGIGASNPLDQKSVAIGSVTPFNSGTVFVNYSNELIYGAAIGGTMPAINAGAGFTSINNANGNLIEFKNGSAAGSYSADFSSSGNGTYVAEMATFRTTGSVLPVKLVSFEVSPYKNGKAKLDWITATETNNDYFEVQHSRDGLNWKVIEKIAGAGNADSEKKYSFIDSNPWNINYYRLNQVDFDGKNEFSLVRIAEVAIKYDVARISSYPNPVENWINIDGDLNELNGISVFGMLGESMDAKISEVINTDSGISLNISSFTTGVYFLRTKSTMIKIFKK
jgi:hypothetical protein